MKKGKLILFSGVSGVGKNSILKELFKDDSLNLVYSISMTTRNKREGEIDKVNYFFATKQEFEKAIENNEFLEWAEYCGNYYGTPRKFVEEQISLGKNVILEIEVKGAMKIMEIFGDILSIFVMPPNIDELRRRLETRGTDSKETIELRINEAINEIKYKDKYSYVVVNDNLQAAISEIKGIIKNEK